MKNFIKNVSNKLGNFFKKCLNTKQKRIILLTIFIIIILVIGVIVFIKNTKDNRKELEKELTLLGKDFYENFYYDLVVENHSIDQISKFATIGIKANLNTLEKYNSDNKEKVEKFVNSKTKEECNKDNTKVIIYPKDPYKKGDYDIEIVLDCNFKSKE